MNIIQIKTATKIVQMSCAEYIVYTFHLSLHHVSFGQFKAKQVLSQKIDWNRFQVDLLIVLLNTAYKIFWTYDPKQKKF